MRSPFPTSQAIGSLDRIASPEIRLAAKRVLDAWQTAALDEPDAADLAEDLVVLATALEQEIGRGGEASLQTVPTSALRRRLLAQLRAEIVGEWTREGATRDAERMVRVLGALERLQQALDPGRDEYFAAHLMGGDGLDHLMEIAHDLRSPLTSILFLAETLRRGQSGAINEVQHRQLGIVYSAALGLTSVVSDVIELARGGSRLLEKEPSPLSVSEIQESVWDIVRPMAEEKELDVHLIPPNPDERFGYPVALSRVLLNLTTNALKFTDDGYVEIAARDQGDGRVEFSVCDTGNGMSPEVIRDLYRPFRRSRIRDGFSFSGTGLGLAICRRLIQAMGGDLQMETVPEQGTRFFFELELPPAFPA